MRKLNSIDWEGAYQAYCSSGLGIRTFIAQEMHQLQNPKISVH